MKANSVLDRLITNLEQIKRANGYRTDAGYCVYRRLQDMPVPESLPDVCLFVRLESLSLENLNHQNKARVSLAIAVSGMIRQSNTSPLDSALLDVLFDIRTACLRDEAFAGLLYGPNAGQMSAATFSAPEPGSIVGEVTQPMTFSMTEIYQIT